MSWLERIDRKDNPLGWWTRLDGAIGRLPGWRIIVSTAIADYLIHSGHWLLLGLFGFSIAAVAVHEFLPKPRAAPSSGGLP